MDDFVILSIALPKCRRRFPESTLFHWEPKNGTWKWTLVQEKKLISKPAFLGIPVGCIFEGVTVTITHLQHDPGTIPMRLLELPRCFLWTISSLAVTLCEFRTFPRNNGKNPVIPWLLSRKSAPQKHWSLWKLLAMEVNLLGWLVNHLFLFKLSDFMEAFFHLRSEVNKSFSAFLSSMFPKKSNQITSLTPPGNPPAYPQNSQTFVRLHGGTSCHPRFGPPFRSTQKKTRHTGHLWLNRWFLLHHIWTKKVSSGWKDETLVTWWSSNARPDFFEGQHPRKKQDLLQ